MDISHSHKRLKKLRGESKELKKGALPLLFLVLGLVAGALMSEWMTIVHEMFQSLGPAAYTAYKYFILIVGPVFLCWLIYKIMNFYIKPFEEKNEEIKQPEDEKEEE